MKKLIGGLCACMLSANLYAADLSYNFVNLTYANVDIDLGGFSIDGNGLDVMGSFEVAPKIFIPVRYQSVSLDFDVDTTMYLVGIGAYMSTSNTMDAFATVQFGNYEMDVAGFGSADDDILAFTLGIRTSLQNNMEGMLYFTSVSMDDDFEDQSGVGAQINIALNKNTAVTGRFEVLSDIDTFNIGVQFDF